MTLERNMALSRYALTGFAERIGLAEKEEQKDSDCQCAQERAKKEREWDPALWSSAADMIQHHFSWSTQVNAWYMYLLHFNSWNVLTFVHCTEFPFRVQKQQLRVSAVDLVRVTWTCNSVSTCNVCLTSLSPPHVMYFYGIPDRYCNSCHPRRNSR